MLLCFDEREKPKMFSEQSCCCCCYSVRALNIIDYEKRCRRYLSRCAPKLKWALLSLESLTEECKVRTDMNAVEYDFYPLSHFLKGLPVTLPFETSNTSLMTRLKYLYFKRKLLTILKDNFFNEYINVTKMHLKTSRCTAHVEEVVRKFIKVCNVLDLQTELTSEDVHQYEFIAELLKICYEANVRDCAMVTSLIKMAIGRRKVELSDIRYVKQPDYPPEFFQYVLEHVTRAKFDIVSCCSDNPRTLWEYSRHFSVVSAVSFGNRDRTQTLLKYGFEVFPECEVRRSGHGFPFIEDVVPKTHQMVLQMMSVMRSLNHIIMNSTHYSSSDLQNLTEDQKECFRLIWRDIPDVFVKLAEMGLSITTEFFHLAQHGILEQTRYEENTKSCIMYEMCFTDMASGAKEPRSLQHLSRCTVRKSLRDSWNLPHGISKLGLPKILEKYLSLETD